MNYLLFISLNLIACSISIETEPLLLALAKGCLENEDLRPRKWWPRKQRPRKPILINNSQTKNKWKKKHEQRTFKREKGDTWREVWLEVNRLSLQALSLFVHFAPFFKTRDFILVPLFILHTRNDYKYLFNPTSWN